MPHECCVLPADAGVGQDDVSSEGVSAKHTGRGVERVRAAAAVSGLRRAAGVRDMGRLVMLSSGL